MAGRIIAAAILILMGGSAQAARQDWSVSHQPDRFVDRVMMNAFADADSGPGRMALYCDSENGFRVMFLPHRPLIAEGPAHITLRIDQAAPVTLNGDAFGDDETDVVTVYGTVRIQNALSTAHHVAVHYQGAGGSADDSFTFGDLAAGRATLMKVCPLSQPRPR